MVKIETVIRTLSENGVDFVVIGGVALRFHSSSYFTVDFDLCYHRTTDNLRRIVAALSPHNPRPRNFPKELPFVFDEGTLLNGTNFTFETGLGDIDLLGEVTGLGDFSEVKEYSQLEILFGYEVHFLTIEGLIKAKRAAGRPKDLAAIPELETLQELKREKEI